MPNKPYPCRISDAQRESIKTTATAIGMSQPETLRQAIDYGLPVVKKKFAKKK